MKMAAQTYLLVIEMFHSSKFATRPLYLQVRDVLVTRIVAGEWPIGTELPSEISLAQSLEVSIGTVRRAMVEMEAERIIIRRQGRGTYVNDQSTSEMSIRYSSIKNADGIRIEGNFITNSVDQGAATAEEAKRLGLTIPAQVLRVDRFHVYNSNYFMFERALLPVDIYPKLPEDMGRYRICVLAQNNNVFLGDADEKVTADMPTEWEATILGVPADQPILRLDRVIVTISGRIAELRSVACYLREEYYSSSIK